MISFFSAPKTSFQKDFAEKDGIILLEVYIPPHMPYLDLKKALGVEYQSMEELEILLPPFVSITIQEETLQHIEKRRILGIKKNRNGCHKLYESEKMESRFLIALFVEREITDLFKTSFGHADTIC